MQTITHNLKSKHTILYVSFITAVLISGCRGDEGPMGRAGKDGIDGNANVSSVQYSVPPSNWSGNTDGYTAILTIPEITTDIYNNGAVLVYRIIDSNKSFNMLPYTSIDTTSITYMDFDVYVGEIDLYLKWVDNGVNDTEKPTADYAFKIVIIEGTPLATLKEQVNISNYKAVVNYLKLKEKLVIVK